MTSAKSVLGIGPWALMGPSGAGKSTLAGRLAAASECHHLADPLRELLRAAGGEVTREALVGLGDALRTASGEGALAALVLQGRQPLVVDGVRLLAEAELLRRHGFRLVFVDTPAAIRMRRVGSGFLPFQLDREAESLLEIADVVVAGYTKE